ncbi:MAG: hypothetical protein ABSG68_06170 [Thermoguttaceae bacterium]|jgi:hypothetical protein
MGFLKKFFRNVFREGAMPVGTSSFERLSEEELETHLGVARYGSFLLTDAVRPSYDLLVVPAQGYRHDCYRDEQSRSSVPVLMASVSSERLFETFMDLLDPLGSVVDVVLETSHNRDQAGHTDLYREHIDAPVLKSILWEYEDLLVNDGCTGLAVLNPDVPHEIQFDEHKLLIIYGEELREFEAVLDERKIRCDEQLKFITEAEHVHSSSDRFAQQFDELKTRLGMDCGYTD